jgi:protein SCO1/2
MKRLLISLLMLAFALPALAADAGTDETTAITARYLLMDANGRAVSNEDFPGNFQLITFGYTFCPDICPTTLAEMSVIMEKLGKASDRLQPLFITVDPERDTPAVLRDYTVFFHPRIVGLTGSPALVKRAADNFKVRYEIAREPGSPREQYAVDHSAGMYLLGPDGRYIRKFAYATPPADIAETIGKIIGNTAESRQSWRGRSGR